MRDKQYILILNKNMEGALLPFPKLLDLPPTKTVGDITFQKTERFKTESGYTARIYTEIGASIDLEGYADPLPEIVASEPIVQATNEPTSTVTPAQPVEQLPPTGVETRIYGRSDDLIEFDGGYSGEVGAYGTDREDSGILVVISDGTLLEVQYGKGGQGIWGIKVLKKGTAYFSFEPCDDEDADIYSDIVTLKGDIKYAYASRDWDKVE